MKITAKSTTLVAALAMAGAAALSPFVNDSTDPFSQEVVFTSALEPATGLGAVGTSAVAILKSGIWPETAPKSVGFIEYDIASPEDLKSQGGAVETASRSTISHDLSGFSD